MIDNAQLADEVLELTLAVLQGDASAEQRARLERLLVDDARAVLLYLTIVDDTLTLCDAATAERSGETGSNRANTSQSSPALICAWASLSSFTSRRAPHMVCFSAVAGLLLAVAAIQISIWHKTSHNTPVNAPTSASIVELSGVEWSKGAAQYDEWAFVKPGDSFEFDAGLFHLFFTSGVELMIEGPADVDLVSYNRLFARKGKLAARVGPAAVGFRIDTPHAQVVDRGTSFGVSVDNAGNQTSVAVYEGIVDLDVLRHGQRPRRRLETGEALSVDRQGRLRRVTTVGTVDFLVPPQFRAAGVLANSIVSLVSDNVRSIDTSKYYRVIPRGFGEDCRAYVDRLHQWNGLDGQGLPPFLLGGDYVMTYNDDKIVTEIEIAIGLRQPANLYLLIDDRVAPPAWLKRDFVDTNWDVGSDEDYIHRVDFATEVGPGRSIDQIFSVWKRVVPDATTVTLGALTRETSIFPARDVERSMYGIVATPLNHDP